jgi:6-pyruvoyltetrahydropterin/6-carboxytetrahydropterin synthase
MAMTVAKRIRIDAAHYLPDYPGKCKNMHGHEWLVEVGCSGPRAPNGMVIDFADLKKFLNWVEDKFDHKVLNDVIAIPTCENFCAYIFQEFNLWCVARGLKVEFVKVWETPDSYVILS